MTRDEIIRVMRAHTKQLGIRDRHAHCLCGWVSLTPGGWGEHQGHLADVILTVMHVGEDD